MEKYIEGSWKMNDQSINIKKYSILMAFCLNILNLYLGISLLFHLDFRYNTILFHLIFGDENITSNFFLLLLLTLFSRVIIWHEMLENKILVHVFSAINLTCNIINIFLVLLSIMEEFEKSWHFG